MSIHSMVTPIFGLPVFNRSGLEFWDLVSAQLSLPFRQTLVVFTPNPEQIVQAHHRPDFYDLLLQADFLIPDGIGLVLASKVIPLEMGTPLQERIAGADLVEQLVAWSSKTNQRILLIGGREYVAGAKPTDQAHQLSQTLYWTPGYQDSRQPTPEEEAALTAVISYLKPTIVLVAFGAPTQEKWIIDHRALLSKNHVKLSLVVGGAGDFLLGKVRRAPAWLQNLGLEWLFRLISQPWRWRRQLQLLDFIKLVWKARFVSQPKTA